MNLIRVHMTQGQITTEPLPEDNHICGRVLIDHWMTENLSPKVHPLSEENVSIFSQGLFAGTRPPVLAGRMGRNLRCWELLKCKVAD
jgi:aldehyde:ferredoxin oxidoreductase